MAIAKVLGDSPCPIAFGTENFAFDRPSSMGDRRKPAVASLGPKCRRAIWILLERLRTSSRSASVLPRLSAIPRRRPTPVTNRSAWIRACCGMFSFVATGSWSRSATHMISVSASDAIQHLLDGCTHSRRSGNWFPLHHCIGNLRMVIDVRQRGTLMAIRSLNADTDRGRNEGSKLGVERVVTCMQQSVMEGNLRLE
jgi:hypothetical protein